MLARMPRILVVSCSCLAVFAGVAAAERAPITYAGQGGGTNNSAAAAPEAVSFASNALSGGDDNSYGYGRSQTGRASAVIDLRRPNARRSEPVVFQEPVREADEDEAPGPVNLTPTPVQLAQAEARQQAPQQPASEQGAQPWLERERVGPPYEANGRWYVPTPEPGYEQTGMASWYGSQFHGQRTASGETFDEDALTAAHPTLPIPSLVQVTNLENGREVIVRVNDRGPFVGERVIDLSRGAATVLGFQDAGHARVHIRYLGPAPRRVNSEGAPAPASTQLPAAPAPAPAEEGPHSLLPLQQAVETSELAGGPVDEARPYAPPPAVGGYFVQVGAFSDPANAQRVRDAVGAAGPVVMDVRTTASGAELFRVRVGPWGSREEADAARRTLSSLGYGDSVVAAR
jgi:rare lipoprotein A